MPETLSPTNSLVIYVKSLFRVMDFTKFSVFSLDKLPVKLDFSHFDDSWRRQFFSFQNKLTDLGYK